jgi:type II protein arginine methyltransferase
VLHTFPHPISVTAGEQVDVMVGNDRTSLIVMPAPQNAGNGDVPPGGTA